jgi:hypothetical protein
MPKRKKISKPGEKKGHGGDRVSPEEEWLSEFRIRLVDLLFEWGTKQGLDHKRKLDALRMASRNVRPAVEMLLQEVGDRATARSDVVLCLADVAGEMLDVVADLTRSEAARTRARPVRMRLTSNELLRARGR